MRVHVCNVRMTLHRADVLEAYLNHHDAIEKATVYERTGDVVLYYRGRRADAVQALSRYKFDQPELDALVTTADSRKLNQEYQEKMCDLVAGHFFRKLFLPAPIRAAYTVWRSIAFVWKGVRCLLRRRLEVEVLDALSIGVSVLRGDFSTAGSVMFLLNLGSLLEEWTRKKSLDDLARSMARQGDVTYGEMRQLFVQEKVQSFVINDTHLTATLKDQTTISCHLYDFTLFYDDLNDLVVEQYEKGIITSYNYPVQSTNWLQVLLPYVLAVMAFILLMNVMTRMNGGAGGVSDKMAHFGEARVGSIPEGDKKVTFRDVAGADEEKEELQEIVEFCASRINI